MRNAHRWRLEICFINVDRLTGCLRTFVRPVETNTPPPKPTLGSGQIRLGGGGGSRTRVQNASRLPELQPWTQYEVVSPNFQGLRSNDKNIGARALKFSMGAPIISTR